MTRILFGLPLICLWTATTPSHAADEGVFRSSEPDELWNDGEFTEGVAVRSDGAVFFSDIPGGTTPGRILQYNPQTGRTTVFAGDSRKSNGLYFDSGDRLFACCGADGGARALCEVDSDGAIVPLVERFRGRRFNSPNDLVVHPDGAVYFSDPRYRGDEPLELDGMHVYRFDPRTGEVTQVTDGIEKPNGVHVSPDGTTLYVAETNNGSTGLPGAPPAKPGRMTLNAFAVDAAGRLSNRRVLVDYGAETGVDGMTVDRRGRIFAAVRSPSRFGIAVYTPGGQELAFVPTAELPTNCCFGVGDDRGSLYVTAGTGLYRLQIR